MDWKSFEQLQEKIEHLEQKKIVDADGNSPEIYLKELCYDNGFVIPNIGNLLPTPWALTQIGRFIGIKWHTFFGNMENDDIQYILGKHLKTRDSTSNPLLRIIGRSYLQPNHTGFLRGFVSSSYSEFRDSQVLQAISTVIQPDFNLWKVLRSRFTDRASHINIYFADPIRLNLIEDDTEYYIGLRFHNSEVGFCSWSANLHIFRLICTNGLIWPLVLPSLTQKYYLSRQHRGDIYNEVEAFILSLTNQVLDLHHSLPPLLNKLIEIRVENGIKELELIFSLLGRSSVGLTQRMLRAAQGAPELAQRNTTAWHVLQALTQLSPRLDEDSERQLTVERLAGTYIKHVFSKGPLTE